MAFVRLLVRLMRDKNIGRYVVPIVPDEARTFGMEALFRQFGIYSHVGQLYEPVDSDNVLYYREAIDGQILEEGINEAGSMSSFIAAGSSRSSHGVSMIPFFIYYSMFGFQRIGDLIWAAGDMRCRGFLLGGTAGRTTLAGEGLQHQDGNSHLFAMAYPTVQAYDPCYAYELSVIVLDGIRRMFFEDQDIFYYITLMNENYEMPILPLGSTEGICRGIYRLSERRPGPKNPHVQLLGSGAILREALRAQDMLESKFGVASSVYSVTSYKALYQDARDCERWNRLHPASRRGGPMSSRPLAGAAGPDCGGFGLRRRRAAFDRAVDRPGLYRVGHRRIRPQRGPRRPAAVLRGRCREHCFGGLGSNWRKGQFPQAQLAQTIETLALDPEKPNPVSVLTAGLHAAVGMETDRRRRPGTGQRAYSPCR